MNSSNAKAKDKKREKKKHVTKRYLLLKLYITIISWFSIEIKSCESLSICVLFSLILCAAKMRGEP